jgi:cation transport regulator ChaB
MGFREYMQESRDPEDIDGPDELPANVEDALPNGAEDMFYDALVDAKKSKPDAEEGVWYAMAWDVVNDHYKKGENGEWIERERTKEESVLSQADEFLNRVTG